jgi:hypothetical protein
MANLNTNQDDNSNTEFVKQANSMQSILNIMDIASELRKKTEDAKVNLDIDILKDNIRKTVLDSAKIKGEELTIEQVDTAINHYISQMNQFTEPAKTFSYKFANAYVNRGKIGRRYGIPLLAATIITGLAWGTSNIYNNIHQKKLETQTEMSVMQAYHTRSLLEDKANTFNFAKTIYINPKDIDIAVNDIRFTLKKTDAFFSEYCPNGNSKKAITKSNFESVNNELKSIEGSITLADNSAINADNLLDTDKKLISTKNSLDVVISEINNTKDVPIKLATTAQTKYKSGLASVTNLRLADAIQYRDELANLRGQITDFIVLPDKLEQVYSSVKSVAKENLAITKADALYNDGKIQVKEINVANLENDVKQLSQLDEILRKDYQVNVVNKDGVKSGIDRYFNGNISSFYLIVEATDANDNVVPIQIKNIENGNISIVKLWGEQVPKEIYERIKEDKMSDGIVDDKLFSIKEKGYISDKIIMKGTDNRPLIRTGQITKW